LNLSKTLNKKLHLVSFDVPYPSDYGGVMDVYHKMKSLAESGIEIYLHLYTHGRKEQNILKKYCKEVHYYQRKTAFSKGLHFLPFIVITRNDPQLIKNLEAVEAPVFFEGIHTTLLLKHKGLQQRKTFVRAHNIEHHYYAQLARTETNIFKKIYNLTESLKLKYYESVLKNCDQIFSISVKENEYYKKKYGNKASYLPAFHPNKSIKELSKKGYFALYHGNLNVADNLKSAYYLIETFEKLDYPLVIAGRSVHKRLHSKIESCKNISFIHLKNDEHLLELFHRAHINILFSFQESGIKLKLINALFQSRYIVANSKITEGTGLESLCHVANHKDEIRSCILKLIRLDFSEEEISNRKTLLQQFNNKENVKKIIAQING
jgi:hypothetical protein